jgi:glycosyltransferase involved in cell wall biosynthesis
VPRVAVVTSHPIQYQAPWFRALARAFDLQVFFCHRQSATDQARAGFGVAFDWDVPLLDGYAHAWLENVAVNPGVDRFSGCDTPGIASALAHGGFDACIVNGWYLKSYLQAIRASWSQRIPVLVRGDSQRARDPRLWKSALKYLPYRWFLRRIDAHLFVGENNRTYLEHYGVGRDQLFFAPHFVDNDRFAAAAHEARVSGGARARRADWGAAEDAVVLVFAGKLIPKKHVGDFIDALGRVAREHRLHGVIIGSGPLEGALRERAAAVHAPACFAGFHNQQEIAAAYAAADALVLPSDGTETWGLVVNEAMAAGLPAVVSDSVGCAPDLIETGRTGFTFPCGDVDALAHQLVRMAALVRERRDETKRYVAEWIARYSCEAATAGTVDAVMTVRARRRPTRTAASHAAPTAGGLR